MASPHLDIPSLQGQGDAAPLRAFWLGQLARSLRTGSAVLFYTALSQLATVPARERAA